MERTKEYSVVNDTLKALKNQGLSERYFQKGHSFSSQPRYDHFDTAAYARFVPAQKNTTQYYIGYIIFVRLSILRRGIKWDIIDS